MRNLFLAAMLIIGTFSSNCIHEKLSPSPTVVVDTVSSTFADISWNSVGNEYNYIIHFSKADTTIECGFYAPDTFMNVGNATNHRFESLLPSTKYAYDVRAVPLQVSPSGGDISCFTTLP